MLVALKLIKEGKRQKLLIQSVMMLLYIRLIDKFTDPLELPEVPQQPTYKKSKVELEQADNTKLIVDKNAEAIRNIQQFYHLERRLFV